MIRRLGWTPDKPDERDYKFIPTKIEKPHSVYLGAKYKIPLVYDQGNLGSCTAQALAFLVHFNMLNKNIETPRGAFIPSRLFIYYYERFMEGTINVDSGAQLRSGIKVLADYGAPSEDLWPYNIYNFTFLPPDKTLEYGLKLQALRYERIDNTDKAALINCLVQGFPICFGMYLFYSFFSDAVDQTGIIPMPQNNDSIVGGHAMVIVGYRAEDDSFIVRNSWGKYWGQNGYCRIPAAYICHPFYASDFWAVKMME